MMLEMIMHKTVTNFRGKQHVLSLLHKYCVVTIGIYSADN